MTGAVVELLRVRARMRTRMRTCWAIFDCCLQKAQAQLAYELQAAKIRQKIRNEEIQIDVVERKKLIEVEVQEVMRKERELNSTVRLPAEAESYRLEIIAEGKR